MIDDMSDMNLPDVSDSSAFENKCTEKLDPKKVLKVFVPDEEQSPYDGADKYDDYPDFTAFDDKHMRIAQENAQQLSELLVDDMIGILSDLKRRYPNSVYVDYLSRVTLFNRNKCLIPPPPSQVLPYSFHTKMELRSGETKTILDETIAFTPIDTLASPASRDPESKLRWWREDPGLSEHHGNWHVYNPNDFNPKKRKLVDDQRRGELFAYMHQQMLARYDCERLAVGLAPVEPYGPGVGWADPLPQGYNGRLKGFSFRTSLVPIPDITNFESIKIYTSVMVSHNERLLTSIARGYLEGPDGKHIELTMHNLGSTVEPSNASANKILYGNLHNFGHLVIGSMSDPDRRYGLKYGPMVNIYTAARDPVFYRWHKYIDRIFEAFRVRQVPHKLDDLKMEDITVLSFTAKTEGDPYCIASPDNIITLYTGMVKKEINVYIAETKKTHKVKKIVLDHLPFQYEILVHNGKKEERDLVFRVFLAPEIYVSDLEDRRNTFIEMDRFVEKIEGNEKKMVIRQSSESVVTMIPGPTVEEYETYDDHDYKGYCGCGWPKNLLLPRGTPAGMKASLYVLVTDWSKDAIGPNPELKRSVAYCGKENIIYPDKRPMGFPFDRPLHFDPKQKKHEKKPGTLEDMVNGVPNSAKTDVHIKDLGKLPHKNK